MSADDGRRDSTLALGLPHILRITDTTDMVWAMFLSMGAGGGPVSANLIIRDKRINKARSGSKGEEGIEVPPKSTTKPLWSTLHDDFLSPL
ncbi:hypothetical protein SPBR_09015 [Sporothrix brasiliensis 5110]|uniref:Uncharacterized protein n=1 Tax=Sporothrix brasiliensis 5110 TaxID=1398154 RepID=A0A0C2IVP8_9PEZI|nr:uncharacterized protein SPBR_09015 [Sporothrix brasiliensis 5110]KIH89057.1 hypothetical protein SPBR_09015 [Sporothrix brasiliensis 5110]